jgi:raffinose/stachyose/melibiose transport system permease protein
MGLHRYSRATLLREIALIVLAVLWMVPFYFLISVSLKPTAEIFTSPITPPSSPTFSNYLEAWVAGDLGRALINSLIITIGSVVVLIGLGSIAAYTLARRSGRISGILYLLFVLGIILPSQLGLIPTYTLLRQIGLVGNYAGIGLLYIGVWLPMSVFLYTGFLRTLPREYEEAAQVDGASPWWTFVHIVFPLLRPVTGTVAILTGLLIWNDFFNALIFLSGTDNTPLPVAVYSFVGDFATRWNYVFAAVAVSLIPAFLFFLFAQRQLIQGFTGGIKG